MNKLTITSTDDKGRDGYTNYKNHDEKLLAKIQSYELGDTFDYMFNEKWTVEAYEGDEVKCVSGKNVKFFKKKEVEDYLKCGLLTRINKENDPLGNFFKQHGLFYKFNEYTTVDEKSWSMPYEHIRFRNILSVLLKPMGYSKMGHDSMGGITKAELDVDLSFSGMKISYEDSWGSICFLVFNEDGSFNNRNYNVDLNYYTQEAIDPELMVENLKSEFLKLGPFLTNSKRTKLYNDKYCIPYLKNFYDDNGKLSFELYFIPKVSEGLFKKYRMKTEKLPATTTEISSEEAWQLLLDSGMDQVVNKFEKFKKRFANS